MDNAKKETCRITYNPADKKFDESIRKFQGCPTIAITKGGRIFAGWYSGGDAEPHIENYNILVKSDDMGATWSKPLLVIESSREKMVQCLDIQLWTAPDGRLFMFWVQNNVLSENDKYEPPRSGQPFVKRDGFVFNDCRHTEWLSICEEPDADTLVFSEPKCIDTGFLRCKPLVLKNGRWINFNYDQLSNYYTYSISDDNGKTYVRRSGAEKVSTLFDETMAYERDDGSVRMLARTNVGELAESASYDGGITWTRAALSGTDNPDTRFFISKLPSGRVLMINNDSRSARRNMSAYLSDDDGKSWKYKCLIDGRGELSYPDADIYGEKIYLVYDRERQRAAEILFTSFTEEDILNGKTDFEIGVISRPK